LNSEPSETVSSDVTSKPKSRLVWISLVAVVLVLAVSAVVYWWWFLRPQTPWLFVGAFAKYQGETTVLTVTVNMTMRLEVLEYNNTHAKLLTYVRMEMGIGEPFEFQNTTWADLEENSFEVEGYDLMTSYEDHVYFEGLGTRLCTIFEYSSADMDMTYYVDSGTGFPLKMAFSLSDLDMDFELTLKETNIPGL